MKPFIDIHTHNYENQSQVISLLMDDDRSYFTYGIHPWNPDEEFSSSRFFQHRKKEKFLGMGEIGIDKSRGDLNRQIQCLEHQIDFALEHGVNFLVLHSVKGTQEIMHCLKSYEGTILLHDYNVSIENFKQFDRKFKTYISSGKMLMQNANTQEIFQAAPIEQIFLETDDHHLSIQDVYEAASDILDMDVSKLRKQLYSNFTNLLESIRI